MTSVTLNFDEELTACITAVAASRGITVQQYVDELVGDVMKDVLAYERAQEEFFELLKQPGIIGWVDGRRPTREEIYEERLSRFR